MADPKRDTVVDLMRQAANELLAAQILADEGERMASSVVFHVQKAVESALAAFLTARGLAFKAKNPAGLLQECRALYPPFGQIRPEALESPSTALEEAKKLLALVTENLPREMGKEAGG